MYKFKKSTAFLLILVMTLTTVLSSCRSIEVEMSSGEIEYVSQSVIINNNSSDTISQDNQSSNQTTSNTASDNNASTNNSSNDSSSDSSNIIIDDPVIEYPDNTDPKGIQLTDTNTFVLDANNQGKTVNSLFNNINLWNVGTPAKDNTYDVFQFTDYVQLMQCSGGASGRDLFKNPSNTSVLDDYDFTKLINACRGILNAGAKPHLKLGGVPMKFTKNYSTGYYNMNANPPDDYNVYYNYIHALASALVDEFGRQEVLSWRFGVMTEYENKNWFVAKSGDADDTKIAYFKLYDYTVQALIDAIGENVFVGAHSMTCTEGLWDEAEFIKHVAQGTNYATGEIGTRICYLSASWYHSVAGSTMPKNQKNFVQTINYLKDNAKKYGLNNLVYGVDEGRMLSGINRGSQSFELNTRTVGYTYQGAFDARLFRDAVLNDIDYFSSWGFIFSDLPSISYYIAKHTAEFEGMKNVTVQKTTTSNTQADIQSIAAYDPQTKTLRVMAYNFKNSYDYANKAKVLFKIKAPVTSGNVKITKRFVDDNCNYFDEWLKDRESYNITNDMFNWSPDDPSISVFLQKATPQLQNTYYNKLLPKYKQAAVLTPKNETATVSNGELVLNDTLMGNGVVFYEIKF